MNGFVLLACVLMVSALLTPRALARAALVVTDVVANPPGENAGRQWVEIVNSGPEAIDLGAKTIRLFTSSGNHLIKAYAGGTTTLIAGSSAVIAENPLSFLHDVPSYAGMLLKSSFVLPLSGIVGITRTDGTVLVEKSYVAPPEVKPAAVPKSTTREATIHKSKSTSSHVPAQSTSYGNGISAPAASADADAAGAAFVLPPALETALAPFLPLLATMWFAVYLALLAFSAFSLFVIQRHYL